MTLPVHTFPSPPLSSSSQPHSPTPPSLELGDVWADFALAKAEEALDDVDIEIPEEYDYRNFEKSLPHETDKHKEWKLSNDLPPEVVEDPEPEDEMLKEGLRVGAA